MYSFYRVLMFQCAILQSCHTGDIWKLESSHFLGKQTTQIPRKKIWEFETSLGCVFCAACCFQDRRCSAFRHQRNVCQGYNSNVGRIPLLEMANGIFKRYKQNGDVNGYVKLGTSDMYVKLHNEETTWGKALNVCRTEGATLVKLDSNEKDKLHDKAFYSQNHLHPKHLWIGLSDMYDNDTWLWTDGTTLSNHSNWKIDEPDHVKYGIKENCVATYWFFAMGVKWHDTGCIKNYSFICERN